MVTKLKLRRIELGIKQKDLAADIKITPQYLMNLEKGKANNPSTTVMKKLATALSSSVQDLFFN